MRIAIAILLFLALPGCDPREVGSSPPIKPDTDSSSAGAPPLADGPSTIPESKSVDALSRALATARGLAGSDSWMALAAYDDAIAEINAELVRLGDDDASREIMGLYREAIAEADQLVEKLETPKYEATIPERDLLSVAQRNLWRSSPGATPTFKASELAIEAVGTKNHVGVCSVGSSAEPPWHDIVLDLEFTLLSGGFDLSLRHHLAARAYSVWFSPGASPETLSSGERVVWGPPAISAVPPGNVELMKPYRITVSVKGTTLRIKQDGFPEVKDELVGASRSGGIGFALRPGSRVVISSCKLKVLR